MSFDLIFYKPKGKQLEREEIARYLTENLTAPGEDGTQWFFENEETGVYYSFSIEEPEDDPEAIELFESFADFDHTRFAFNLNFIRPNFFGLEAFPFVERFIDDLDLYVLNPQSSVDDENPRKETADSLYNDWSRTNLSVSSDQFNEFDLRYYPLEASNRLWEFGFHRSEMQSRLGDDCFVAGVFFVEEPGTSRAATLTTWTEHIPSVLPPVDYVAMIRKRKKLFRTVEEIGIVTYENLMSSMGRYFDDYEHHGKIIHPDNAERAGDVFNSLPFERDPAELQQGIAVENVTNAKPADG